MWRKTTDEELNQIAREKARLAGKIQARCGVAKEEAERQIHEFERRCDERWGDRLIRGVLGRGAR